MMDVKKAAEIVSAITGRTRRIKDILKIVEAEGSVFMASKNTTALNANVSKSKLFFFTHHIDSSPDLVEIPARSNHQVDHPRTKLNCIDQLLQDHIASCLASSNDLFSRAVLK
jgi:hypothetical protein